MSETTVVGQVDLDAAIACGKYGEDTAIIAHDAARVYTDGRATVHLWDHSYAELWGQCECTARDRSVAVAHDGSSICACDSAVARADGRAELFLDGLAAGLAYGDSVVSARGRAMVCARDWCRVTTSENALAHLWDKASAIARGNSRVDARDYATVRAEGTCTVHAAKYCAVWQISPDARVSGEGTVIPVARYEPASSTLPQYLGAHSERLAGVLASATPPVGEAMLALLAIDRDGLPAVLGFLDGLAKTEGWCDDWSSDRPGSPGWRETLIAAGVFEAPAAP